MSKVKPLKTKGIPNRHLHARTTFLYQAATYLTLQTATEHNKQVEHAVSHYDPQPSKHSPLALQLGSDLHQVSQKGQLRLSIELKRSVCKSCNTVLIPGLTTTQVVENLSKGGRKPWADVLIQECSICGGKRRFPIGAKRQLGKAKRKEVLLESSSTAMSTDTPFSESTHDTGTEKA